MKKHKKQTSRSVHESQKVSSTQAHDAMGPSKVSATVQTIGSWHLDRLLNPYWAGRTATRR